jgi:hypothetical protein
MPKVIPVFPQAMGYFFSCLFTPFFSIVHVQADGRIVVLTFDKVHPTRPRNSHAARRRGMLWRAAWTGNGLP